MKPIIIESKLPKFIVVSPAVEKEATNKHLLNPWKAGEMVKVAPYAEQVPCTDYDDKFLYLKPKNNVWQFRKRFVVVYRKDAEGKFTKKYTASWDKFNLIVKKQSNDKK